MVGLQASESRVRIFFWVKIFSSDPEWVAIYFAILKTKLNPWTLYKVLTDTKVMGQSSL